MTTGQDWTYIPAGRGGSGDDARVGAEVNLTSTGTETILAAPGSGSRYTLENVVVTNRDSASAGAVTIKSGNRVLGAGECAKQGGGWTLRNVTADSNAAITATLSGASTDIIVSVSGYKTAA